MRLIHIGLRNCICSWGFSCLDGSCWFFYYAPFTVPCLMTPSHLLVLIKLYHKKIRNKVVTLPSLLSNILVTVPKPKSSSRILASHVWKH